jgi:hypothetical protein
MQVVEMAKPARKLKVAELEARPVEDHLPGSWSALPAPGAGPPEILPITRALEEPPSAKGNDELFSASLQGLLTLRREKSRARWRARLRRLLIWVLLGALILGGIYAAARWLPQPEWLEPLAKKAMQLLRIGS